MLCHCLDVITTCLIKIYFKATQNVPIFTPLKQILGLFNYSMQIAWAKPHFFIFCVKERDYFLKYSLALDVQALRKSLNLVLWTLAAFSLHFQSNFSTIFRWVFCWLFFKPLSTYESSKLKRALNSRKRNLHDWKTIYGRVVVKKPMLGKRKKYIVAVATGLMDQNLTFLVKISNICG